MQPTSEHVSQKNSSAPLHGDIRAQQSTLPSLSYAQSQRKVARNKKTHFAGCQYIGLAKPTNSTKEQNKKQNILVVDLSKTKVTNKPSDWATRLQQAGIDPEQEKKLRKQGKLLSTLNQREKIKSDAYKKNLVQSMVNSVAAENPSWDTFSSDSSLVSTLDKQFKDLSLTQKLLAKQKGVDIDSDNIKNSTLRELISKTWLLDETINVFKQIDSAQYNAVKGMAPEAFLSLPPQEIENKRKQYVQEALCDFTGMTESDFQQEIQTYNTIQKQQFHSQKQLNLAQKKYHFINAAVEQTELAEQRHHLIQQSKNDDATHRRSANKNKTVHHCNLPQVTGSGNLKRYFLNQEEAKKIKTHGQSDPIISPTQQSEALMAANDFARVFDKYLKKYKKVDTQKQELFNLSKQQLIQNKSAYTVEEVGKALEKSKFTKLQQKQQHGYAYRHNKTGTTCCVVGHKGAIMKPKALSAVLGVFAKVKLLEKLDQMITLRQNFLANNVKPKYNKAMLVLINQKKSEIEVLEKL